MTKARWVEIMEAAGFDDQAMITWHQKFEEMEPEEHQKFLESLGIDATEIHQIRGTWASATSGMRWHQYPNGCFQKGIAR